MDCGTHRESQPGPKELRIREASVADVAAMIALERSCDTAAHWREDDYIRIFANGGVSRLVLLMEEDGVLVALVVAANVGAEWEIENIAVAPASRLRGLGTKLMGDFISLVRSHAAESVFLEVRESNAPARLLYEKSGFVKTGWRRGYYSAPVEDAIVYRLQLRQQTGPE